MTPDGITTEDWNRVHSAACDIVNASGMEDEVLTAHYRLALFDVLDELEQNYGRLSSILATRADFSDDPQEAIPLLEEALERSDDRLSSILALHSLVGQLVEARASIAYIEKRLQQLEDLSDAEADEDWIRGAQELRQSFERTG